MTQFANWLSPMALRLLALALLHFLWQGAALAALAYMVMSTCRSASTRYAVAVVTLLAMLGAPLATYVFLKVRNQGDIVTAAKEEVSPRIAVSNRHLTHAEQLSASESATPYFLWLVEIWIAGVVLLSLRSVGGFLVVERLRRRESIPVSRELLERCLSLERRMGLERAVRYCESLRIAAPAVAGWIHAVVLLPVTAITGLSEDQLDAVIAHELAHIQRHDAIVHLFQVGVETLLFYHPAVWWIGKRIRVERENCCDDIAVALCGNPVTYAQALTRMAEWKAAPQLAMAANRSPLVERIARVLGARRDGTSFRGANLAAGVLCLSSALLAGTAFFGDAMHVYAQRPEPSSPVASASETVPSRKARGARIPDTAYVVRPAEISEPSAAAPGPTPTPAPAQTTPQSPSNAPKQSYIDSLKDAGLTNLSVDDLIGLKVQGVTAEYVRGIKDLGVKIDADELIGMKVQGITPEYVKEMSAATGQPLDADALIGLKVQGVKPEYVREMHDLGVKADADEIIGMKVQGVTPEYVRSFQDGGLHPSADELIGMKVQGVTAAYIKELQGAGLKVDIDDAIGAKVQGITAGWIAKVRSHGFNNLTLDKLIQLKNLGVIDNEK